MPTATKTSAVPSQPMKLKIRFAMSAYPRHRSVSTDRTVRNSPKAMKLR